MIIANDLTENSFNQMSNENNNGSTNLDEIHLHSEPQYEIIICSSNDLKRKFNNDENFSENLNQNFHIEFQCQSSDNCCKDQQQTELFDKCNQFNVNTISENYHQSHHQHQTHQHDNSPHHSQISSQNNNNNFHIEQQEMSYINLTVMHPPHSSNHEIQTHSSQTAVYTMNNYPPSCTPSITTVPPSNLHWSQPTLHHNQNQAGGQGLLQKAIHNSNNNQQPQQQQHNNNREIGGGQQNSNSKNQGKSFFQSGEFFNFKLQC
jgi:hypothetical protein